MSLSPLSPTVLGYAFIKKFPDLDVIVCSTILSASFKVAIPIFLS
jgi:hypothetical protein